MAKLNKYSDSNKGSSKPNKSANFGASLDTLEQLSPNSPEGQELSRNKFIKRQIAKAITLGQIFPLIDLDSPLKKSYWYSFHCNNLILQEGYKMTTKYCGHRWCTLCNRIRMAKMINAYSVPLLEFKEMQFVTLTAPNVDGDSLKLEIDGMLKNWRGIYQYLKKKKVDVKGLRKLECTHNPHTGFNPHFHFLIEGKETAQMIVKEWLKRNPLASSKAQDIRAANQGGLIELFKYAVKGVHKGKFYPKALDTIYQAMYRRQTFRPIGIKKVVEDDIEGIKSQQVTFKGFQDSQWSWEKDVKDWVNEYGELLTEYIIEGKLSDWIESLKGDTGEQVEDLPETSVIRIDKNQFEGQVLEYWGEYVREEIKKIDSS